ncbi:hypothetical protein VTL71DRAFT_12981 [Oculimacula yallundae]|uniref:Uncharacterized protein n=1 Tax=Oculimacula yallundae TaxID=86028 RepID=A0ABR4CRB2_9HELO
MESDWNPPFWDVLAFPTREKMLEHIHRRTYASRSTTGQHVTVSVVNHALDWDPQDEINLHNFLIDTEKAAKIIRRLEGDPFSTPKQIQHGEWDEMEHCVDFVVKVMYIRTNDDVIELLEDERIDNPRHKARKVRRLFRKNQPTESKVPIEPEYEQEGGMGSANDPAITAAGKRKNVDMTDEGEGEIVEPPSKKIDKQGGAERVVREDASVQKMRTRLAEDKKTSEREWASEKEKIAAAAKEEIAAVKKKWAAAEKELASKERDAKRGFAIREANIVKQEKKQKVTILLNQVVQLELKDFITAEEFAPIHKQIQDFGNGVASQVGTKAANVVPQCQSRAGALHDHKSLEHYILAGCEAELRALLKRLEDDDALE